jgi:hypothetical protein
MQRHRAFGKLTLLIFAAAVVLSEFCCSSADSADFNGAEKVDYAIKGIETKTEPQPSYTIDL